MEIYAALIERQRPDLADSIAKTLVNRGFIRALLNQPTNALADYNNSLDLWYRYIKSGHTDATNELPTLLIDRATTLTRLNQATNAVFDCETAIAILKPQIAAHPQLYSLLGKALIAEGIA